MEKSKKKQLASGFCYFFLEKEVERGRETRSGNRTGAGRKRVEGRGRGMRIGWEWGMGMGMGTLLYGRDTYKARLFLSNDLDDCWLRLLRPNIFTFSLCL